MNRIRILLLALAVTLWTSLAAGDPNLYWCGPRVPACNVTSTFGADNTGVSDSAAAQGTAWNRLSVAGLRVAYPAGTYKYAVPQTLPSNMTLDLGPSVIINQQLTPTPGSPFTNSWLWALGTAVTPANVGTLNGTPNTTTAPAVSISVSLATSKPVVGHYLLIQSQGASKGGVAVYEILSVSGAASPWTVGIDRPMIWPFVSADIVTEMSAVPHDIRVNGNGAVGGGTGDQQWEFGYAKNITIKDLHYDATLGFGAITSTAPGTLDVATISSLVDGCHANLTGAPVTMGGYQMQSNERSVMRNMRVTGMPAPGGFSYGLFDNFQSGLEDSWVYGGNATANGVLVDTLGAGFPGNRGVWIRGGGAVGPVSGTGYAMLIQGGAQNTFVSQWSATGGWADDIILSASGPTRIAQVSGLYATQAGLAATSTATDLSLYGVDFSHAGGGAGHNSVGAVDLSNTGLTDIDGLTIDIAAGEAVYAMNLSGSSNVKASKVRITTAAGTNAYAIAAAGARLDLSDSVLTSTGGGFSPCVYVSAGTVTLHAVVGTCPNGLYTAGGTTLIGADVDLSGSATPVTNAGGTITAEQAACIYTSTATTGTDTMPASPSGAWCNSIYSAASLGGDTTINAPAGIKGLTYSVCNAATLNAHTWSVGVTGGTAISIGAGKCAIVKSDGTNMIRISPDT